MMGPYFQQPRKKINQKAQGKKELAEGGAYVPHPRHLVVNNKKTWLFGVKLVVWRVYRVFSFFKVLHFQILQ